jgi:hypothetical protein
LFNSKNLDMVLNWVQKEINMSEDTRRRWWPSNEWLTLMGAMVGCFLFVHHENALLTQRLDTHISESNKRLDDHITQINSRCDDLHKEFYELLKEMRKT